jgi:hypothetical protein
MKIYHLATPMGRTLYSIKTLHGTNWFCGALPLSFLWAKLTLRISPEKTSSHGIKWQVNATRNRLQCMRVCVCSQATQVTRVHQFCVGGLSSFVSPDQGCQMVCFQTKNPNFGKFWRALEWKMFVYFITIWNNLRPFGIIYDRLV